MPLVYSQLLVKIILIETITVVRFCGRAREPKNNSQVNKMSFYYLNKFRKSDRTCLFTLFDVDEFSSNKIQNDQQNSNGPKDLTESCDPKNTKVSEKNTAPNT